VEPDGSDVRGVQVVRNKILLTRGAEEGQQEKINRMRQRLEMRESATRDLIQRTQRLWNVGCDTQWLL
jgi:hypothetical protein